MRNRSQIIAKPLEHRVAYLALRRLGTVFDLGKQFRLDPNALVRDPLGIGLSFPDQRLFGLPEGFPVSGYKARCC